MEEKDIKKDQTKEAPLKPDPETLNTADPQDEMKGPVSSLVQATKETIEDEGGEKPEDSEQKKD